MENDDERTMGAGDGRDDDGEVEEYARRLARGSGRRLVLAGVIALVTGIAVHVYGRRLNARQATSEMRASLPDQLELVGVIAGGLGALFLVLGTIKLLRARRAGLPRARAID